MANDVSKEECCGSLGTAYNDAISSEAIFMILAGMKRENCKPCKGKINSLILKLLNFQKLIKFRVVM